MKKRAPKAPCVVLLTGGTGGHVYPAVALAEKLLEKYPDADIAYMGGGVESSAYLHGSSLQRFEIPYSHFSFRKPLSWGRFIWENLKGMGKARRYIKEKKPDLVVAFGSYHTFSALLGLIGKQVPFYLYDSNAIPGKITRYLCRFAKKTFITYPSASSYLKGEVEIVLPEGRKNVQEVNKEQALLRYGLKKEKKTAVFVGGSQGALGLETTLFEAAFALAPHAKHLQWIHVTGKHGDVEKARKMYQKAGFCACVIPYEEQMGYLWTAADFAVTRAGSGVLQELTESLTPAVVVPFPRSADGHQQKNAEFFQDVIGGGVTCVQETEELCRQLTRFLEEPSFIETCKSRMLEYRQSLKYHSFSESVCKVLGATT